MNLPPIAYAKDIVSGKTICIERGRGTYFCCGTASAEDRNRAAGVTTREAAAMLIGASMGWDHPHADPAVLSENEARFFLGLPAIEVVS